MLPHLIKAVELVPEVKEHLSEKSLMVLGLKYDPNQPRVPAGDERGGEWTSEEAGRNTYNNITDSPEFKAWFGDSKAVDENGKPIILYHGTNADFQEFDTGMVGSNQETLKVPLFFFSDSTEEASLYGSKVMPVYIKLENPLIENTGDEQPIIAWEWMKGRRVHDAIKNGNDGIIMAGNKRKLYVVFSPTQIKSVNNLGSFDPDDPNIMKSIGGYDRQLWEYTLALYRGGDSGEFIDKFTAAISNQLRRAWNEGARSVGVEPEDMTEDDRNEIKAIIDSEYEHILDLGSAIEGARESTIEEFRASFRNRIDLWIARYTDVINRAKVYFGGKTRLEWKLGETEQHCETCAALNGIVAYAQEWEQSGVRPQSPPNNVLECGGWQCDCSLVETDKRRSPNALQRIMDIAVAANL